MCRRPKIPAPLLLLVLLAPALAAAAPLDQALAAEVARTAAATRALGGNIVELATAETVSPPLPAEPRVIASNSKLFTPATALDPLGPGYFFEPRLVMRGAVD